MSDEERRTYRRNHYKKSVSDLQAEDIEKLQETWVRAKSSQRERKRNDDLSQFKQNTSAEKSAQRAKKRKEDELHFNKTRASEISTGRAKKRQENEKLFKGKIAVEKSSDRAKKRQENEKLFKENIAAEKSSDRAKKRQEDEIGFKRVRCEELTKTRNNKRQEDEIGFKRVRCEELTKTRNNRINTEGKRAKTFKDSIRDGRIFQCVSCHRVCFKNGVLPFTRSDESKIEEKFPGIINCSIGTKETTITNGNHHICTTCKSHISKGKVPPMSHKNNLQLIDLSNYEELHLTELENSMIALNIIFQKVFKLPKSRWPAMKDRTVNIPIFETDVLNTIKSLPRTPSQAGIIPINFKRKLNYKNSHMVQYISVPKILKALNTLKKMGNRYYKFIPQNINFVDECHENDLEGFQFIYPEDEINREKLDAIDIDAKDNEMEDNEVEDNEVEDNEEEDNEIEKKEAEYQKNDPVKKWQFDYNKSTCFSDNYPEIHYNDESKGRLSVAPGEGKCPSSILQENDWDLKSFPCLLPDGENSLHSERERKLSEQDYFTQRIMNKDPRFATNPAYIFAAVAFIEKKQIEGRKGIAFKRGKATTSTDGMTSYSLEDPYSVLDNVKNTPRYWQKMRYELMARLENLGAFTYFFTLSCADMRWPENFSALLQDQKVTYENKNFKEEVLVNNEPLMDYLMKNESKHAFIKKNLLNATLTFHHRVKMFVKNIIMSKGNPMCINYNSYKVEFALRGAGHIHGVLWMDWKNFTALEKGKVDLIEDAFKKIRNDEPINKNHKQCLSEFADLFITCSLKNPLTKSIVELVQMHRHTQACTKYCTKCRFFYPRFPSLKTIISVPFQKLEESKEDQIEMLEKAKIILKKVKSVLEDDETMEKLMDIGREEIDEYIHMQETIIFLENLLHNSKKTKDIIMTEIFQCQIKKFTKFENVTMNTSKSDLEKMLARMKESFNLFDIKNIEKIRLQALLDEAGIFPEADKSIIQIYEESLGVSQTGYKVIHRRDINEIYVNNYSTEWIINWNANMDLQLCLDFYAVITYISDYYSKDDSGTMRHIREALRQAGNESLQAKLSLVIHTFLTHRQIGESEAFFKILPHLHMKSSNIETVFVPTGFKGNRSSFLKQLTKDEAKTCQKIIRILNRDGVFTEKPSLLDKFERKDISQNEFIEDLSYTQFCMKYTPTNSEPRENDLKSETVQRPENGWTLSEDINFIVTHDFTERTELHSLPKMIQLREAQPGEPRFMRIRSRNVVRYHKFNKTKNPHEYYYAQLQMYSPFNSETELEPDDLEKCKLLFNQRSLHNDQLKIQNVKSVLMPHLEYVEEGVARAEEMVESNVGATLDPELEQDNDDCEDIGVTEHQDFIFKDPTDLNITAVEVRRYKPIDLCEGDVLDSMTRNIDEDQREVLEIGVHYAKSIVKAKKSKEKIFPPLLIVQGGAGTGKSTVIDILSQQMEKVLRTGGDNPDHPYIIKAAFTGTAAANIKGQTLHSAFSFSFGNEFFSLSDKVRDERRSQLENLLVVIIDEFSMMKADMLYQLDLRLKEIKQQPELIFGGVTVFLFGDIMQLKPVLGRYIFEEPINESFLLSFLTGSLWKKFDIVILRHNHRQGEDKMYAEILNRLRIGEVSEEDEKTLETRVRPLNHPDIPSQALVVTCRNLEVNQINEDRLMLIDEVEHVIDSMTKTNTQKHFKPRIDPGGNISGTPLQRQLKLKVRAKVMLTYNINTFDCLTNGALAEVLGFKYNKDGSVKEVYVHFQDEDCGKETRKNLVSLQTKFPGKNVTPIEVMEFQFSISKKDKSGNKTASCIQFPLKLAFAATAHKVQGQTVKKPNSLVIDLRTVREAAQAYVILSRVQALSQLFILVSVCAKKIMASIKAIEELERMDRKSEYQLKVFKNEILSCNIRSFNKNFSNFINSSAIKHAKVICLQETWLDPIIKQTNLLETEGWERHNNSVGKGKGIVTLIKKDFVWERDVTDSMYQITKIQSDEMDIINLYRSAGTDNAKFLENILGLISSEKQTFIMGDFNICYVSENSNQVFQVLRGMGFHQLVKHPTHIEGRMIDLVFFFSPDSSISYTVRQQAQYFTDHDLLHVVRGDLNRITFGIYLTCMFLGFHSQD